MAVILILMVQEEAPRTIRVFVFKIRCSARNELGIVIIIFNRLWHAVVKLLNATDRKKFMYTHHLYIVQLRAINVIGRCAM